MGKKAVILGILALALGLGFNGCAAARKKPVSETKAQVVKPTSPAEEEKIEEESIVALKGKSIPLAKAPEGRAFAEPTAEIRYIFTDIPFDFDKSEIKREVRVTLDRIASWLRKNSDARLMIEGHCDERGTGEYNLALGERRALSVRRYLIGLRVPSGKLHTISYGESKPADPGHNENAWAKNRRVHFLIAQ